MTTMHALVLHQVGDVRYEPIPCPEPGPGQVRIRVGYCGVCGSDIPRLFEKGTYRFPLVCGHEFAGTVDLCGPDVEGFEKGQAVTVFPLIWCGRCSACERGNYAQCFDYSYLGSRENGAFAEYVVAPACNLLPVPEGVSLEEAAMTEPAAVALHALRRTGRNLTGLTVAVFGCGPIGLLAALWARLGGAAKILLFDVVEEKLSLARGLGFARVFSTKEEDPVRRIEIETMAQGADICIEAAGVPATLIQACSACGRGGHVVLLGNPATDVVLSAPLLSQMMRREVTVVGTWNSEYGVYTTSDDWHTTLSAMATGQFNVKPLISHKVPLVQAVEMLQAMHQRRVHSVKVLIAP
ncbi:theronine dehydrogenase-like Zn-dependent dehydrogenase [Chthonomonas calidirosea]|uniref:Threonine dehydrogenase and related Zn-dependent dehydrogenases n=1 Tax=Chthonomonas calidirosea (strain DSM 23976 / ICMP 18418 / T49) TaxID=1303518 RepID=S0EVK5_CHTCT|nr:galactitol-1-phosphate 5-dehydrogenase [Chthonomonas calidirosea]CCW35831.1 Threonine dehydrogenase and related Zn-dependent dehydrogenases [Chthonomonas calidirosea T49]CEK19116.1 theronine dehydrogenase-like Zn-dependent dehydrogenase [Chthonomonas calidirosea]